VRETIGRRRRADADAGMAIKEKNTFVIGVNLERLEQTKPQIKNAMDILFTSDKIRYKRLLQI